MPMPLPILTLKTGSFYMACVPDLAVISYGDCLDEAVNNLREKVQGADEAVAADGRQAISTNP